MRIPVANGPRRPGKRNVFLCITGAVASNTAVRYWCVIISLILSPCVFAQDALPPILLTPYNGTDVTDRFVTWTWFMQPRVPSGDEVLCDLNIVEVLPGQTPEEALRSNPTLITKEDLRSSAWQASLGTRGFQTGHTYAWRIVAHADGRVVSQSEIWTFTFLDEKEDKEYQNSQDRGRVSREPPPPPNNQQPSSPQQPPVGVKLTTKSRLTLESSNRPAQLSKRPQEFARLEIDPTIDVNGAPLQLGILITTEKNQQDEAINRGTFNYQRDLAGLALNVEQRVAEKVEEINQTRLDVMRDTLRLFAADSNEFDRQIEELSTLKEMDPVEAIKTLNQFGASPESFLLDIPSFGFGAVSPRFTDLTLNGVTLNGGFAEYNPGDLYVALAFGKVQRTLDLSRVSLDVLGEAGTKTPPSFFRNLYGARLGYGRKEGSNLIVSLMYGQDDNESRILERLLDTSATAFASQENLIMGIAGRIGIDPLELALDGEMNVSLFNDGARGVFPTDRRLSRLVTRLFNGNNVREESFGDISYSLQARKMLFDRQSRVTSHIRMVGPGYRTIGVADLRTDVFGYDINYEHNLIRNLLTATATFGVERSGFIVRVPNTARLTKAGITADVRARNMPAVQVSYSRTKQEQTTVIDSLSTTRVTNVDQYAASLRHLVRLGNTRLGLFLTYSLQKGTSDDGVTDFRSTSYAVTNRFSFAFPMSIALTLSHSRTRSSADTVPAPAIVSADFSVLHNSFGCWQNLIGITYADNKLSRTRGGYLSSGIELEGYGAMELRWEYNEFASFSDQSPGFVDKVLRLVTRVRL